LVAIISGLRSPWIMQAIKTFKGIGQWEMRVFNDLKVYVTSADDFKYIRQAIADIKSQDVGSHASVVSGGDADVWAGKHKSMTDRKPSAACVPFIGDYSFFVILVRPLIPVQVFICRSFTDITNSPT
jgi:hypothetical protein